MGNDIEKPRFFSKKALFYKKTFFHLCENDYYASSIIVVILVNAVFLALDHYPQSAAWDNSLAIANYVFCTIFVVDVIIKFLGYGFYQFMRSWFNVIDLIVTILSVIEIILLETSDGANTPWLSALRCTRLLRILKTTGPFPQVAVYAQAGLHSVMGLAGVMICVLVVILIASLMGMQLFGGKFYSRTNYNSFVDALITSLQVESGEGWNEVMMEAIQVSGGHRSPGLMTGLFFVATLFIGHYILLGIMLAITSTNLDHFIESAKPTMLTEDNIRRRSYSCDNIFRLEYKSLYIFDPENRLRKWCHKITLNRWFDRFILFCILSSSVLLAVEDYVDPNAPRNDVIWYFDVVFTAIFLAEMFLKIVSLGFALHKGSFCRSGWNLLDAVAVLASVFALAITNSEAKVVKVLRIIRVVRPLRAIQRFQQLQQVVNSMMASLRNIWGLVVVAMGFMFFFAVMGVALFKGMYSYCTDETVDYQALCVGNFSVTADNNLTIVADRVWETHYLNFDNVLNALSLLASIITFEEAPVMYQRAMDSTEIGKGPELHYKREAILYFLVYLFGMALFFLNIVMAFVGDTYKNQQDTRLTRTGLLASDAKCINITLQMKLQRDRFLNKRDWWPFKVVTSLWFDLFIAGLVMLNLLVLLMKHDQMSDDYAAGLDYANYILVGLFVVEAALKISVLLPGGYFTDSWNVFDFVIVSVSLIDVSLDSQASSLSFLRLFRTLRLMKVFEMREIRYIFELFIRSMSTMAMVLVLLLLVFYMYAVFGMALFAGIPLNDDTTITEYNNFQTFPSAMLVLFRTMSGERWQSIMQDVHITEGPVQCGVIANATECGSDWNEVYFNTFSLFTNLIVLNILLAAVVDSFEYLFQDPSCIQPRMLTDFKTVWAKYDPLAKGTLHYTKMPKILREVMAPLGVGFKCSTLFVSRFLAQLPVPIGDENHEVAFRPMLMAIVRVRLDLWQYEFPDPEALRDIIKYIAPGMNNDVVSEAFPDSSESMTLRILCV